jgi:hypothetical protein
VRLSLLACLLPALALARTTGIVTTECKGCHGGMNTTTIATAPLVFTPGQTITVTVSIGSFSGGTGGLYLRASNGTFAVIAGQITRLVDGEIVHSSPKAAVNALVTFDVLWTAPAAVGAVDFEAFTVAANNNGSNSGDSAGVATRHIVYGCAGTTYYRDIDGDGVGAMGSGTTINCAAPAGYSMLSGDCDDTNPLVKPGGLEACNAKDDNCNGQVDEGLTTIMTWPDVDGDGYGAANGTAVTGCPGGNRAPNNLDCNDIDPALHPGATEICNFRDDDCDGQYDEGVTAKCGVGWCLRSGTSCDPSSCTPATPLPEHCNKIDDDCNGVIDDGDICPNGQVCRFGECIFDGVVPPGDGGTASDAGPAATDAGAGDAGTPPGPDAGATTDAGTTPPSHGSCSTTPGLAPLLLGLWTLRRRRPVQPERSRGPGLSDVPTF